MALDLPAVKYGLKGRVKISVVEKGRVVREYPEFSNLIYDWGLNAMAGGTFNNLHLADMFKYAVVGTSASKNYEPPFFDTSMTVTAGAFAITGTFLIPLIDYVGLILKLDSGEAFRITDSLLFPINTGTCIPYYEGGPTSAGPSPCTLYFNAYHPNLGTEVRRTNTYLTEAGACGTRTTGNTTRLWRTFDFPVEVAPITYKEVGFSPTGFLGDPLFSSVSITDIVPGGAVIGADQQLRVTYSLSVTVSPTAETNIGATIGGWTGNVGFGFAAIPIFYITSTGFVTYGRNSLDGLYYGVDLVTTQNLYLSTSTLAHNYGSYYDRAGEIGSNGIETLWPYVPDLVTYRYKRRRSWYFASNTANSTNVNQFHGVSWVSGFNFYMMHMYGRLDAPQTKADTHSLTLSMEYSWDRII